MEEMIKEKLIEAMSKPLNIDEEASENNIEDANPIERIKCYLQRLDGVVSMKLYYGCQLGNLLEKMFSSRKGHMGDTYKGALMKCKIKVKWAYFYEDYTNFATFTKRLITTTYPYDSSKGTTQSSNKYVTQIKTSSHKYITFMYIDFPTYSSSM